MAKKFIRDEEDNSDKMVNAFNDEVEEEVEDEDDLDEQADDDMDDDTEFDNGVTEE